MSGTHTELGMPDSASKVDHMSPFKGFVLDFSNGAFFMLLFLASANRGTQEHLHLLLQF